jgi:hypothetical protein
MRKTIKTDENMSDSFVTFKYQFDSGTGPLEGERYVRDIKMEIFSQDEDGFPINLIGKVEFKIIYVAEAIDSGYNLYEIFDSDEYTFRHSQTFFDFKTGAVKEAIQKYYNYDIVQSNICILEKIEILPGYRGCKIGAKATKDIIFHFGSGIGLFVIQAFPLQFESKKKELDEWQKQQELSSFPSQENIAFKKLSDYYKSFGFDKIPGYKDLLFYNPAIRNARFDAIDLEE